MAQRANCSRADRAASSWEEIRTDRWAAASEMSPFHW